MSSACDNCKFGNGALKRALVHISSGLPTSNARVVAFIIDTAGLHERLPLIPSPPPTALQSEVT